MGRMSDVHIDIVEMVEEGNWSYRNMVENIMARYSINRTEATAWLDSVCEDIKENRARDEWLSKQHEGAV